MEFIEDLIAYIQYQKKWWLIPILLAILVAGFLLITTEGTAVATFIYPLF